MQKKVDPSLQVDIRPVYSRRIKDERDRKQQDDMRRRYIEDKWRYAIFLLIVILQFFVLPYILYLYNVPMQKSTVNRVNHCTSR